MIANIDLAQSHRGARVYFYLARRQISDANMPKWNKETKMANSAQKFEYGPVTLRKRYDNFICGKWIAPVTGCYFTDTCPLNQM